MTTSEPEYYTVTVRIGDLTYIVGRYLVTKSADAYEAAEQDFRRMYSLKVTRGELAGLPSLLEAQGLTPDDIAPIYF